MLDHLRDQQIVVVGGASGIGLEVARGASAASAHVTILDLDEAALERAKLRVPSAATARVDVLDEAAVRRAFDGLTTIDHVYVAAGTTRLGSILDGDVDDQLRPLMVRLVGSVHVVRAAAKRVRGSFTFTGGLSTDRPVAGAWVSGVATAAAEQLARTLALDLAPIRFNAVSPGWTDTPMWDAVLGDQKAAVFASVAEKQLTKRLSNAEEVARAVLFLMSNEAMTGEVIHVDGGGRLV